MIKKFKLASLIFLPVTIGVVGFTAVQLVSCGASIKGQKIHFNNMTFNSTDELAAWAKKNLKTENTSQNNQTERWSFSNGYENTYYDDLNELTDFIVKNNIVKKTSFFSSSVGSFIDSDTSSLKTGRILNYPLSNSNEATIDIYEGIDGNLFFSKEDAIASMLQIHNGTYLFDNKYFTNKEILKEYLTNVYDFTKYKNFSTQTKIVAPGSLLSGNLDTTNLNSDYNKSILRSFIENQKKTFIKTHDAQGKEVYIDPENPSDLQTITDIPYTTFADDAKGTYILDTTSDTPGTLFAPYIYRSELNPNGIINNPDSWKVDGYNIEDRLATSTLSSSVNLAYSLIMDSINVSSFADLILTKNMDTYFSEDEQKEFDKFNESKTTLLYAREIFNNLLLSNDLKDIESQIQKGKRYNILTLMPTLRSALLTKIANQKIFEYTTLDKKTFNVIEILNKSFDIITKILDFKVHKQFDYFLSDRAKAFSISKIFDFADSRHIKAFDGTDVFIQSIIDEKGYFQEDNIGGLEMFGGIMVYLGIQNYIEEQRAVTNYLTKFKDSYAVYPKYDDVVKFEFPENFSGLRDAISKLHNKQEDLNSWIESAPVQIRPSKIQTSNVESITKFLDMFDVLGKVAKNQNSFDEQKNKLGTVLNSMFNIEKTFKYDHIYNADSLTLNVVYVLTDEVINKIKETDPSLAEKLKKVKDDFKSFKGPFDIALNIASSALNFLLKDSVLKNTFDTIVKAKFPWFNKEILDDASKAINSLSGFFKNIVEKLHVEKFISALGVLSWVGTAISTLFDVINAFVGVVKKQTYSYRNGADTFFWNGGSRTSHSLFGIDFGDTDVVDINSLHWIPIIPLSSQLHQEYYAFGEFFNEYDQVKQRYIQRIKNGLENPRSNENVVEKISIQSDINNSSTIKDFYNQDTDKLIDDLIKFLTTDPNKDNYLKKFNISIDGLTLNDQTAKLKNIEIIIENIKPVWIAQLPILDRVSQKYKISDFVIPATKDTPLYGTSTYPDITRNKYFIFDENNVISVDAVTSKVVDLPLDNIRQMFIKNFAIDNTIRSKTVLKFDAYRNNVFDDVAYLLNSKPIDYYTAHNFLGQYENFLDLGSATAWVLANIDFKKWLLNAGSQIYIFKDKKFLSISEFVNWVLKNNGVN